MGNALKQRDIGFTLVEMMVVVAIVVILSAVSVPSFRGTIQSFRAQSTASTLRGALQFARSEAIKQGIPVTMCVSSNGSSCTSGNSWQSGWITFADPNADKTVGTLLKLQKALTSTDTLVADQSVGAVTFSRDGFMIGLPGTGDVTFTIRSTPVNTYATRCVAISKTGRSTTQTAGTGACS